MYSNAHNYIQEQNGAALLHVTSCDPKCESRNLLSPTRKRMWLSLSPPPQKIIVDLNGLIQRPYTFKCFGFDCWHDYPTNPARIKIEWGQQNQIFQCQLRQGLQLFQIGPIKNTVETLQITILQNFGGKKTYMNQIFLFQDHPSLIKDTVEATKKNINRQQKIGFNQHQFNRQNHKNNYKDSHKESYRGASRNNSQNQQYPYDLPISRRQKDRSSQVNKSFEKRAIQSQSNSFLRMTPNQRQIRKLNQKIQNLQLSNRNLRLRNQQLQQKIDQFKRLIQKMKRTIQTVVDNQARLSVQIQSFGKGLCKCNKGLQTLSNQNQQLQRRLQQKITQRLLRQLESQKQFQQSTNQNNVRYTSKGGHSSKRSQPIQQSSSSRGHIKQIAQLSTRENSDQKKRILRQIRVKLNERAQRLKQICQQQQSSSYSDHDSSLEYDY